MACSRVAAPEEPRLNTAGLRWEGGLGNTGRREQLSWRVYSPGWSWLHSPWQPYDASPPPCAVCVAGRLLVSCRGCLQRPMGPLPPGARHDQQQTPKHVAALCNHAPDISASYRRGCCCRGNRPWPATTFTLPGCRAMLVVNTLLVVVIICRHDRLIRACVQSAL